MPDAPDAAGHLRIGELSRRVGVSTELLRAWERRYHLLSPTRTAGGFRLYGDADEQRVRRMLRHLDAGVSAAEGARLALAEHAEPRAAASAPATPGSGALGARLRAALDGFDDAGAHAALDELLSTFAVETVLRDAVLPYLHELGERWERGEVSIGQEHFASSLAARAAARARARLGQRRLAARAARLRAGRPARPRPDLLRARPAPARLADRLPRPRHAARPRSSRRRASSGPRSWS